MCEDTRQIMAAATRQQLRNYLRDTVAPDVRDWPGALPYVRRASNEFVRLLDAWEKTGIAELAERTDFAAQRVVAAWGSAVLAFEFLEQHGASRTSAARQRAECV